MNKIMIIITSIFYIFNSTNVYANNDQISSKLFKNINKNKIVFMRHATAPGTGDPENFILNDCATQRNLDNVGIEQSKEIAIRVTNELR